MECHICENICEVDVCRECYKDLQARVDELDRTREAIMEARSFVRTLSLDMGGNHTYSISGNNIQAVGKILMDESVRILEDMARDEGVKV